MRPIDYPNVLRDLVVAEYAAPGRLGFAVKPVEPGLFRLLVWPYGLPDADLFRHALLEFRTAAGPPQRVAMDLTDFRSRDLPVWAWALIETTERSTPLADLARVLFGEERALQGRTEVHTRAQADRSRCLAWSCHMPFETRAGRAVVAENALDILGWYADQAAEFRPHVVWGIGDTAYSDGTSATDFANEVYEKGSWFTNPERRAWLRREYRRMYRHFWSLDPLRRVLPAAPHLFIWDDHEIRDGWGSEGRDFRPGNVAMFEIAKDVAEEFILSSGPRVRPGGEEAHQAYIQGPMAAFVFDTRSTRNYEGDGEKLISRQQFHDFERFLGEVRRAPDVTDLITSTSVPFVGLRTWVTELITRAPDFLNDSLLEGVRDDVRDSWTSPGNRSTLTAVLGALRSFMHARPDVRVSNVSGDIHVAQAFEIHVPGAPAPIYQLTTSSLTNRTHPSDLLAALIEIAGDAILPGVGYVRRIWETVTDPNVLTIDVGRGSARFDLRVWNPDAPGEKDLALHF